MNAKISSLWKIVQTNRKFSNKPLQPKEGDSDETDSLPDVNETYETISLKTIIKNAHLNPSSNVFVVFSEDDSLNYDFNSLQLVLVTTHVFYVDNQRLVSLQMIDLSHALNELGETISSEFVEKLIRTLSHEERNPLNTVINMSSSLFTKHLALQEDASIGIVKKKDCNGETKILVDFNGKNLEDQDLKQLLSIWSTGRQMKLQSDSQMLLHKCLKEFNVFEFEPVQMIQCNEEFCVENDPSILLLSNKLVRYLFAFERLMKAKNIKCVIVNQIPAIFEIQSLCIDWKTYTSILYHLI